MSLLRVSYEEALEAAAAALAAHGASPAHAAATGRSVVVAEAEGNRPVGLASLANYCEALACGRADGTAEPLVEVDAGAIVRVEARTGLPHLGFERARSRLLEAVKRQGLALLALRHGFTCGALGYFPRSLAEEDGLAALAAANGGPAVIAASGGRRPVFCTNPMALAVPTGEGAALVVDQSSSASALVSIRQAADEGRAIPEGWALDADGRPTTDPAAALEGSLLPFGGARGANIALIVELLAAGLTGATWSFQAPPFNSGKASPGVGLFVVAIDPERSGGGGFSGHLSVLLEALRADPGAYLPGIEKGRRCRAARSAGLEVDEALWRRVLALAG